MDASDAPEGIDPKSACRIEVNVKAYFTVRDGKKVYNRDRTVCWVVDSEAYSCIDLENDIASYFTWDSNQKAYLSVLTVENLTCELTSDDHLLDLLRSSQLVKFQLIVRRREEGGEMPSAVNMVGEDIPSAANDVDEDMPVRGLECRLGWAEVPQYGETTAGPPMAEEEKEHFMTVGCDPHGDEPTGVYGDSAVHGAQQVENAELEVHKRKRTRHVPDSDTECVPDDEAAMIDDYVVTHATHDSENPVIKEGDTFGDKNTFILTMRTYAIKNEFDIRVVHSDKDRYRARCADENCDWRVFAKKLHGGNAFMVVKLSQLDDHTCSSSARMKGHQASTAWISHRAKGIVKEDPTIGAKKLQKRLEKHYNVELPYFKVWSAKKSIMEDLHDTWEESFIELRRFQAALVKTCPGSIVEISCKNINGKTHFSRMFVCIKACVDGFLSGCRPYLGVDSTHLTGKYNGQLAAATAIDGQNWMYPVAYGIFGEETNANWAWFMGNLKKAIGTPPGLTIHTDTRKGLAYAVNKVFKSDVEHRECFRHLMASFQKKFKGEVLKYMWPCAWACTACRHDALMEKITTECPKAIRFLNKHHKLVWSRSKFSKECKVDYVNNDVSECFNNWIKDFKDLPIVDLMDKIREKITENICIRQEMVNRIQGRILPSVIHELNMKSRGLHYDINESGPMSAEISGRTNEGKTWRYRVDISKRECGCGQWDVSGKPCTHAIYLFGKVKQRMRQLNIEDFVHDYYSVERFKMAYQFQITPMIKSEWPKVAIKFDTNPPPLQRAVGRLSKQRIKVSREQGKRGLYQCKRCFQFGHIAKGCEATQTELEQELPPPRPNKRKKTKEKQTST